MQTIYKNENERGSSGKTNSVDFLIYTGRIGGYLKGEYIGGLKSRTIGI